MSNDDTPPSPPNTTDADAATETLEELTARHKKELKSFEGEKRAAIKTAKSKGKKAKGAVKDAEFKYDGLERDLKERHRLEMTLLNGTGGGDVTAQEQPNEEDKPQTATSSATQQQSQPQLQQQQQQQLPPPPTPDQLEEAKRQKALQKKLKKKSALLQKEHEREQRIAHENATAGPSRRVLEMEALAALYLKGRKLKVEEVEADGNCLYRAVGAQCVRLGLEVEGEVLSSSSSSSSGEGCYSKIRRVCGDVLMGPNRSEYEAFAEFGEGHDTGDGGNHPNTYEEYVHNVKSTSTWGGQLELRALSEALKCPIVVFSSEGPPLTMGAEYFATEEEREGEDNWGEKKALLLSFHRHYYALGEHYNSVIPM